VPRHILDPIEHAPIDDSLLLQTLHEPLASARRGHANAAESRAFREAIQA
jgi:hypothetical protein